MSGIDTAMAALQLADTIPLGRQLPHIPLEILQQIATHLDRKSAYALTLTCKGLRDAGETKLYEAVHLTAEVSCITTSAFNVVVKQDEAARCLAIVTKRLDSLGRALDAYPCRSRCVRDLFIQPLDGGRPDNTLAKRLVDVIVRLEASLHRLYLNPLLVEAESGSAGATDMQLAAGCYQFFCLMVKLSDVRHVGFSQLDTLHMRVPISLHRSIPQILQSFAAKSSSLRELHLAPLDGKWLEHSDGGLVRDIWQVAPEAMPGLRVLSVHALDAESIMNIHLDALLGGASGLEEIRVTGDDFDPASLQAMPRFADLRHLKRVVLLAEDTGASGSQMRTLTQYADELVVREDIDEMDELEPTIYHNLKGDAVRHVTIVTPLRPPLSDYIEAGKLHRTADEHDQLPHHDRLGSLIFEQLLSGMPKVDTIMFYYDPRLDAPTFGAPFEPDFFVPPTQWEAGGHRGYLIRQFVHPTDITRSFYHIRYLSRHYYAGNGQEYMGFKRHWRENARYRHCIVPPAIIAKVYRAEGLDRDWLTPGREMSLKPEAWAELDLWRDSIPSELEDSPSISDLSSDEGGWEDDDGSGAEFFDDDEGLFSDENDDPYDDEIYGW